MDEHLQLVKICRAGNGANLGVVAELGQSSDAIDSVSDKVVSRFERAGEKVREESKSFNISSAKSVALTEDLLKRLRDETVQFRDSSKDNLLALQKASDGMAVRTKEIEAQMEHAMKLTRDYSAELKENATTFRNNRTNCRADFDVNFRFVEAFVDVNDMSGEAEQGTAGERGI